MSFVSVMPDSFPNLAASNQASPYAGTPRLPSASRPACARHAQGIGERRIPFLAAGHPGLQALELHVAAPALGVVVHVQQGRGPAPPPLRVEVWERREVAVVVDGGGPDALDQG